MYVYVFPVVFFVNQGRHQSSSESTQEKFHKTVYLVINYSGLHCRVDEGRRAKRFFYRYVNLAKFIFHFMNEDEEEEDEER